MLGKEICELKLKAFGGKKIKQRLLPEVIRDTEEFEEIQCLRKFNEQVTGRLGEIKAKIVKILEDAGEIKNYAN